MFCWSNIWVLLHWSHCIATVIPHLPMLLNWSYCTLCSSDPSSLNTATLVAVHYIIVLWSHISPYCYTDHIALHHVLVNQHLSILLHWSHCTPCSSDPTSLYYNTDCSTFHNILVISHLFILLQWSYCTPCSSDPTSIHTATLVTLHYVLVISHLTILLHWSHCILSCSINPTSVHTATLIILHSLL